jgi:dTDP-4-dehydrorhamnose 3,5-epimerase-like enzyme
MTEPYRDGFARGCRWDSPALAITWPIEHPILSERDAALPLFA